MTIHRVKCLPGFFEAVKSGRKPFEIRFNDRDYREGDTLVLCEYFPHDDSFSGDEISRSITYVTGWEQQNGYVVLGIADQSEVEQLREIIESQDNVRMRNFSLAKDLEDSLGEITRTREALKEIKRLVLESKGRIWTGAGICEVVNQTLSSSHRDDRLKGAREYYKDLRDNGREYDHGRQQLVGAMKMASLLGVKLSDLDPIPGITEES